MSEVEKIETPAPEVAETATSEQNVAETATATGGAEAFHFEHKIFYLYQLHEPGDVREFGPLDLANMVGQGRGHRASDCSGDPEKCIAVAAGNAAAATADEGETTDDDSSAARSNDEGGRPSADAGQNTCNFPGCGRSFPAGAVALNAHKRQKKH